MRHADMLRRGWDAWCVFWARARRNRNENENEPRQGGGASTSKKLLAAFAVLAVVFAALAFIAPVSDADETATSTAGQSEIAGYKVYFDEGLKASVSGNSMTLIGYATAGVQIKVGGSLVNPFDTGGFTDKTSAAFVIDAGADATITATETVKKLSDTSKYAFLIPKDDSKVTVEITKTTTPETKTTLTFDFSEIGRASCRERV